MDLSTTYLGLSLRTPLVPSASPLSSELEQIRRMEVAGASVVVLYSLFDQNGPAVCGADHVAAGGARNSQT